MVFVISTFGPTWAYPDQKMMKKTLTAFLNSLARQSDQNFMLFISCHDVPDLEIARLPFIHWLSMSVPDDPQKTRILDEESQTFTDIPWGSPLHDMSRKTVNSMREVVRFVIEKDIESFWVLRMDSDDLLAKDHIGYLNQLDPRMIRAVYNRTCHMIDPVKKEVAIHQYPYSTTCNAIFFMRRGREFDPKNIYYLCNDHTLFHGHIRADDIPYSEKDFTLCILTNTGNSISGRPELDKERFIKKIPLTEEIIDRYGFDPFESIQE